MKLHPPRQVISLSKTCLLSSICFPCVIVMGVHIWILSFLLLVDLVYRFSYHVRRVRRVFRFFLAFVAEPVFSFVVRHRSFCQLLISTFSFLFSCLKWPSCSFSSIHLFFSVRSCWFSHLVLRCGCHSVAMITSFIPFVLSWLHCRRIVPLISQYEMSIPFVLMSMTFFPLRMINAFFCSVCISFRIRARRSYFTSWCAIFIIFSANYSVRLFHPGLSLISCLL